MVYPLVCKFVFVEGKQGPTIIAEQFISWVICNWWLLVNLKVYGCYNYHVHLSFTLVVCNAQPSIPLYDRPVKKALKVPQMQNRGCIVMPSVFRVILVFCVQYFQAYFGGLFVLYSWWKSPNAFLSMQFHERAKPGIVSCIRGWIVCFLD